MNPFINPMTSLPFLKNYIFEPDRLIKNDKKRIKKFRDKAFQRIVKYAYTVPVYHKKYKDEGIRPNDIKGIDDLHKLPFITKKELMKSFPNGITSTNYKKRSGILASTSGSTGKPVFFYVDFTALSKAVFLQLRLFNSFNIDWKKTKFANVGNLSEATADRVFEEGFIDKIPAFLSKNLVYNINAFGNMKHLIDKLNIFEPDIIMSYPATFQQLAYFKKKDYLDNLNPKLIVASGSCLDDYTREYIESAFDCRVVDMYSSAEASSCIAFECKKANMHINSDLFHLEVIDENMNIVDSGKKGHIVMSRMFGKGTPFVRYTGMDDWISIERDHNCDCGLCTDIIRNGIEGRTSMNIILPDGRVFPASSFAIVPMILRQLNTYKVTQFQIVQKNINNIEIHLVIDEDLRDVGPSLDFIFKKIKDAYLLKVGQDVNITVKEVKKIKSFSGKPSPLIVSNVKIEDGEKVLDL